MHKTLSRETKETKIELELNLYGKGNYQIKTGINFFDHMLEQLAYHGSFDLKLNVQSLDNDHHHVVEDTAIVLGQAFNEALGNKAGIKRYGYFILPMDEALIMSAVDLGGRIFSRVDVTLKDEKTSDFETVLLSHFFTSFSQSAKCNIHIKMLEGVDTHHIIEGVFKSFARALNCALSQDPQKEGLIPSTKGII